MRFERVLGFADAILETLGTAILVLDSDLKAVVANPAFRAAFEAGDGPLEGKSVDELVACRGARAGTLLASVGTGREGIGPRQLQIRLPSGKDLIVELRAHQIHAAVERPYLILVELHDITPAKKSERRIRELHKSLRRRATELEQANKELEAFSYSASHDLRAPLRLINRITHLLLKDCTDELPYKAVQQLEMILEGTRQMGALIDDLITFSRVTGRTLRKEAVDVKGLVRQVVDELRREHEGRSVEIQVGDLPVCYGDPRLLRRVFENLLGNAFKFTRPRPVTRIEVGVQGSDGNWIYFVRDNGVGFDMAHVDSLFVVFHRLHQPDEFEGSGIGLALAKRIVDRHNGRLWAEGEINKGATFYLELPLELPREDTFRAEDMINPKE